MIVSASRRTDIPAYYTEWFMKRLEEGFAYARNPFNRKMIRRVPLDCISTDCLVLWTKDAAPMFGRLHQIDDSGIPYYFQYTITPYGREIEPATCDKKRAVETFRTLCDRLGPDRVIWRYDPVLINDAMPASYHLDAFGRFCEELAAYTSKCIFSFADYYRRMAKPGRALLQKPNDLAAMHEIGKGFAAIAEGFGLALETCAEEVDLSAFGIRHACCVDGRLVERLAGRPVNAGKDPNQRPACGCAASVDIGTYDSCPSGCLYCYASAGSARIEANMARHDPASPLLIGWPEADETVRFHV